MDNVQFKGISREDNEMLVGVISEAEVKEAVWNCDSSKSPGPDGFNFGFIKFCWDIIKGDVMSAVKVLQRVEVGQKVLMLPLLLLS